MRTGPPIVSLPLAALPDVAALTQIGNTLRDHFQAVVTLHAADWLLDAGLTGADWADCHALELDLAHHWQSLQELLALEQWLTTGFIPAAFGNAPDAAAAPSLDALADGTGQTGLYPFAAWAETPPWTAGDNPQSTLVAAAAPLDNGASGVAPWPEAFPVPPAPGAPPPTDKGAGFAGPQGQPMRTTAGAPAAVVVAADPAHYGRSTQPALAQPRRMPATDVSTTPDRAEPHHLAHTAAPSMALTVDPGQWLSDDELVKPSIPSASPPIPVAPPTAEGRERGVLQTLANRLPTLTTPEPITRLAAPPAPFTTAAEMVVPAALGSSLTGGASPAVVSSSAAPSPHGGGMVDAALTASPHPDAGRPKGGNELAEPPATAERGAEAFRELAGGGGAVAAFAPVEAAAWAEQAELRLVAGDAPQPVVSGRQAGSSLRALAQRLPRLTDAETPAQATALPAPFATPAGLVVPATPGSPLAEGVSPALTQPSITPSLRREGNALGVATDFRELAEGDGVAAAFAPLDATAWAEQAELRFFASDATQPVVSDRQVGSSLRALAQRLPRLTDTETPAQATALPTTFATSAESLGAGFVESDFTLGEMLGDATPFSAPSVTLASDGSLVAQTVTLPPFESTAVLPLSMETTASSAAQQAAPANVAWARPGVALPGPGQAIQEHDSAGLSTIQAFAQENRPQAVDDQAWGTVDLAPLMAALTREIIHEYQRFYGA